MPHSIFSSLSPLIYPQVLKASRAIIFLTRSSLTNHSILGTSSLPFHHSISLNFYYLCILEMNGAPKMYKGAKQWTNFSSLVQSFAGGCFFFLFLFGLLGPSKLDSAEQIQSVRFHLDEHITFVRLHEAEWIYSVRSVRAQHS